MTKENEIKRIKASVTVDAVLARYGIATRKAATGRVAACPIHGASAKSRAFTISKDGHAWYCFGACQRGGSVVDLVMAIEKCDVGHAVAILGERQS